MKEKWIITISGFGACDQHFQFEGTREDVEIIVDKLSGHGDFMRKDIDFNTLNDFFNSLQCAEGYVIFDENRE